MPTPPQITILAGPNGSGKSTSAAILLPPGMTFVNADMIAQEMSGRAGSAGDIAAGRILLKRLAILEEGRDDFVIETTLATKVLASRVQAWQEAGYRVRLIFMWLPSPDLAVQRVAGRVADGGHDVPEVTIRRRYQSGINNLIRLYRPAVDSWMVFNNSTAEPELVATGSKLGVEEIDQPEIWSIILSMVTA